MKETRCDCCGKVIEGYYPEEEAQKLKSLHSHVNSLVGIFIKLSLRVEYRNSNPIKHEFCNQTCLIKFLSKNTITNL